MKRIITAAVNKREALEKLAAYVETIYQKPMYAVKVDGQKNCVCVLDQFGDPVTLFYPGVEPVDVDAYKYRKATQAEIDAGEGLYVREKYTRHTFKQLSTPATVIDVNPHR